MTDTDGVLAAIDACLHDSLSPDSMRWAPDEPDPTPAVEAQASFADALTLSLMTYEPLRRQVSGIHTMETSTAWDPSEGSVVHRVPSSIRGATPSVTIVDEVPAGWPMPDLPSPSGLYWAPAPPPGERPQWQPLRLPPETPALPEEEK